MSKFNIGRLPRQPAGNEFLCMPGAMRWVQTLNWPGLEQYNSAERLTLLDPDTEVTEAYVKAYDRFKFYWILGAGHSVGGQSLMSFLAYSHQTYLLIS